MRAASPDRRLNVLYHDNPGQSAPCVVLEAGANSWSPVWTSVAFRLKGEFRVLSYDRAGFGLSDVDLSPTRSVRSVAADLVAAIRNVGAEPPYILVAHSLGALFVNVALDLFPSDDILGVVYVDAASPDSVREIQRVLPRGTPPRWLARLLGSVGLLRVVAPKLLATYYDVFSARLRREALATWARGDWLLAYTREWTAALQYAGSSSSMAETRRPCTEGNFAGKEQSSRRNKFSPRYYRCGGLLQRFFSPPDFDVASTDTDFSDEISSELYSDSTDGADETSLRHSGGQVEIGSVAELERHLHHQHEQEVESASALSVRKRFGPGWLGDLPISVIVPDLYDRTPGRRFVGQIQRRVTEYSSDVEFYEPKNCGHFVQLDQPECVVEAVLSVARRAEHRRIDDEFQ